MKKPTNNHATDRIDAAFNRVLAAEAEARDRVEACRREAATLLAAAQERARAIGDLADRRMRLAHRVADRGVERALAELDVAPASPGTGESVDVEAQLDRVMPALADEILGLDSDSYTPATPPSGP